MIKLKPCPFCGCTDVDVVDEGDFSFIECSGCLGAFYQREACSVEDNVEAWNKRTLKEQEPQSVIFDRQCEEEPGYWVRKGFCPKCHQLVLFMVNREYCGFCGQKVKWE